MSRKKKIKVALLFDPTNKWIQKVLCAEQVFSSHESRFTFKNFLKSSDIKGFDIVFILGYTKVLGSDFLSKNALNLVIHESDLPKGRGFSPVQWQVLEGKNRIPVCMIECSKEVDSGDIIMRSEIILEGHELFDHIREKQGQATIGMISEFLRHYPNFERIEQTGKPTYYQRRTDRDDQLDIDKTIREQFNHMRVANNDRFPLYFTYMKQKYYLKIEHKKV